MSVATELVNVNVPEAGPRYCRRQLHYTGACQCHRHCTHISPNFRADSPGVNTVTKSWGFWGSEDTTKWSDGDGRTGHKSHQYY